MLKAFIVHLRYLAHLGMKVGEGTHLFVPSAARLSVHKEDIKWEVETYRQRLAGRQHG